MANQLDYSDLQAVITGASGGIGAQLARELASRGTRVALVARRQDRLESLAKEIEAAGGRATVHVCDVSDLAAIESTVQEIVAELGGFDMLFNNAGYVEHILFKDQSISDIEQMTRTNYLGTAAWMKHAIPIMRSRKRGWIVNLSSFAGLLPQVDEAAYSATKAAVTALSEVTAHELAPLGIHVMAVHPVLVRSEMFTDAVMARMPRGTAKSFMEADEFCRLMLGGLDRGETSMVIPKKLGTFPKLKSLFPKRIGRKIAKYRLEVLDDVTD